MKIGMVKSLPLEAFSNTGSDKKDFEIGPVREENESFMEFLKKGSGRMKNDPLIQALI